MKLSKEKIESLKLIISFTFIICIFLILFITALYKHNMNSKEEVVSYKETINLCDCILYVDKERRIQNIDCKTNKNNKLLKRYGKTN